MLHKCYSLSAGMPACMHVDLTPYLQSHLAAARWPSWMVTGRSQRTPGTQPPAQKQDQGITGVAVPSRVVQASGASQALQRMLTIPTSGEQVSWWLCGHGMPQCGSVQGSSACAAGYVQSPYQQ